MVTNIKRKRVRKSVMDKAARDLMPTRFERARNLPACRAARTTASGWLHSRRSLFALLVVMVIPASVTPQTAEIVIRGGVIANADERTRADIRIRNGTIAEIGRDLDAGPGGREIDASGLLVLPGGIDPHTHLAPNDDYHDDYESGSRAALAGGVTTISNQVPAQPGEALTDPLDRTEELIRAQAIADVFLHPIVLDPNAESATGLAALVQRGQPSVKVRLHRGAYTTDPFGYTTGLMNAADAGVLTMMHAEDGPINHARAERLIASGRGSIHNLIESRPDVSEEVAVQRAAAMSEATGAPVYIVHLAAGRALRAAQEAQSRGLPVYVETRPVYLHYTADVYQQDDAELYLGVPPIRPMEDQKALWEGIADGSVHVVGTDHVPYTREHKLDPSQKVGQGNFLGGMPNLQEYRPMLYSEGVVKKRITLERFVQVTASNPAKLFGLYPRKGIIAVGSDADIVLWDPNETRTIRDEDMLSGSGFSVYSGWEVTGWPVMTIRRGEVVYENGKVTGKAGSGQLIRRQKWQRPTLP